MCFVSIWCSVLKLVVLCFGTKTPCQQIKTVKQAFDQNTVS
ncbi:hypothetical protein AO365_0931 [Moraxella catarrhalis]|nr:hypothetical protein AO365_0931 [Moraxella catarrhalis]